VLGPDEAFDSIIAARKVHKATPALQIPSPGLRSGKSRVLFTVKVAAAADWGTANNNPTMAMTKKPLRNPRRGLLG
jgi:hypothetical protein